MYVLLVKLKSIISSLLDIASSTYTNILDSIHGDSTLLWFGSYSYNRKIGKSIQSCLPPEEEEPRVDISQPASQSHAKTYSEDITEGSSY